MRVPRRRWARVLLVVAALLLAAVVAAVAIVRVALTGPRLAALLVRQADAALAGRLAIGSAALRFPLHLELDDVTLRDPAGEVVLEAAHVELELALLPLVRHTLALDRVAARGVWADLATSDPAHRRGLAAAVEPRDREAAAPSRPWAVRVGEATVEGLELTVAAGGAPRRIGPARIQLSDVAYAPGESASLGRGEVSLGGSRLVVHARASDLATSAAVTGDARAELALGELTASARALGLSVPPAQGTVALQGEGRLGKGAAAAQVTLEGDAVSVAGVDLGAVSCEARTDGAAVRIEDCTARPPAGGAIHVAGRLPLEGTDRTAQIVLEDLPARVMAEGLLTDVRYVPELVSGVVHVEPPRRPSELARLSLRLEARGVTLPRLGPLAPVTTITGTAALGRESIDALDLTVVSGAARATVRGSVSLAPGGPVALDVTVEDVRPSWIGKVAPGVGATGLQLKARVGGSVAAPAVSGVLSAQGARYGGAGPFSLQLPIAFGPAGLSISGARIEGAGGAVTAQGRLGTGKGRPVSAKLEATLQLANLEVAGLAGRVHASTTVSGSLSSPRIVTRLEGHDLVFRGVSLGELTATARGGPARGEARGRLVMAGGVVDFAALYGPGGIIEAEAHGRGLELGVLRPVVPTGLGGIADVDLLASGPLASPIVQGHLSVKAAELAGVPLGAISGEVAGTTARATVRLGASGPSGTLSTDLEVTPRTRAISVVAHARDLVLEPWLQAAGQRGYGGRVDLDLRASGILPYPDRLEAEATVNGAKLADVALPAPLVVAAHSTEAGHYQVDARLGSLATVTAAVASGPPLRATAHAVVDGLRLQALVPRLAELGVGVTTSGRIDAEVVAPGAVSGAMTLTALDVTAGSTRLRAAAPVRVRYAQGEAHVDSLHLVGDQGVDFVLAGSAGRALDLSLEGQLDAGVVAVFVPQLAQASGSVRLRGRATGTAEAPSISGELDLFEPIVLRPRTGVREVTLEGGRVTARTTGPETTIEVALQGAVEGGGFSVSGKATLAGLAPRSYAISASGQNLPVRSDNLVLESNADLRVTGDARRALVAGRVDIVRGRYLKKFELKDFNFVARQPPTQTSLAAEAPWLSRVQLDVTATSEAGLQFRVDAGVASVDLQLSSDVHIGGTALTPLLEGRVDASRGTLEFPKAKLEVSQAVVDLGSGGKIDIDLSADGEVTPQGTGTAVSPPTYFIQLHLSGNLDQMALELTSTPDLNRLEILALLVRGEASLVATGGGDTSTLDAALAFAGSQLTGPLSSFLSEQLERTLNLKLELGAEVTSTGLRLTATQQVSKRLSIQGAYERALGTAGAMTSARARLLLTDRLFLEGSTRSGTNLTTELGVETSQSRLELKWRLFGM